MTSWFVPATPSIDENAPDELPAVDRDRDRWPFEPGTYTLGAARQVTMATAGGMEPMDGVLLKDGERKLMFNFEEEQWMPAKPCPF
ncbi:hypothetical protein [Aquamicrobium sp. LC103]|jgi:hypothetical protein|uniref:hypothetical protein n=1 Tax=Aquamicrobium sp. LC103 TaxID=1120658 RepID=UPI00063E9440|nr:hypothetical protein [Aquamicrobium sp. LC103]TKT75825.1 hypothetical protein XW59_018500 [Aquamicrobium sp. LC103]